MQTKKHMLFALLCSVLAAACAATSHPTVPAKLGVARTSSALDAVVDQPGPITVETLVAADWEVDLGGLVNLDHPAAKAANLVDETEPIKLFVHVVHHPQRGTYLVDTGVERAFSADPTRALLHGMMASMAHVDRMKVRLDTAAILKRQAQPIAGVFLTHLHADHILGMRDVPNATPIYVGPGDAEHHAFMNVFMRGMFDSALANKGPLRELQFTPDNDREFEGLLDVFGDGSLWAIWLPGHTPGTIAYLARTPSGPVLLAGDASHTAWGWKHGVEPGTFSEDPAQTADSFARLQRFVKKHPDIDVRLGHQVLDASGPRAQVAGR